MSEILGIWGEIQFPQNENFKIDFVEIAFLPTLPIKPINYNKARISVHTTRAKLISCLIVLK